MKRRHKKKILALCLAFVTMLSIFPYGLMQNSADSSDADTGNLPVEESLMDESGATSEESTPEDVQEPSEAASADVLPEDVTGAEVSSEASGEISSETSSEVSSEASSEVSSEVSAASEEVSEEETASSEAVTEANTAIASLPIVMGSVSGEGSEEDAPAGETVTVYRGGTFTFGDKAYHWYGTSSNPDSLTADVYPVCGYDFADDSVSLVKTEITDDTMRKAVYYAYGADGYWNGEAALEEYFIENGMAEEDRAGMSYLMVSGFAENVYHLSRQTTGAETLMEIVSTLPAPGSSFHAYALDDAATENTCDMVLFSNNGGSEKEKVIIEEEKKDVNTEDTTENTDGEDVENSRFPTRTLDIPSGYEWIDDYGDEEFLRLFQVSKDDYIRYVLSGTDFLFPEDYESYSLYCEMFGSGNFGIMVMSLTSTEWGKIKGYIENNMLGHGYNYTGNTDAADGKWSCAGFVAHALYYGYYQEAGISCLSNKLVTASTGAINTYLSGLDGVTLIYDSPDNLFPTSNGPANLQILKEKCTLKEGDILLFTSMDLANNPTGFCHSAIYSGNDKIYNTLGSNHLSDNHSLSGYLSTAQSDAKKPTGVIVYRVDDTVKRGQIRVCKSSTREDITKGKTGYGQPYSFDGAVYAVTSDLTVLNNVNASNYQTYLTNGNIAICKITDSQTDQDNVSGWAVDASGSTKNFVADNRTYYIKEVIAPAGYELYSDIINIGPIKEGRNTVGYPDVEISAANLGNHIKKKVEDAPKLCYLSLKKISSNTNLTNGNSNYSLAGCVFDIYSGSTASGNPRLLTTDKDGKTGVLEVGIGTYTIKERTAPTGFKLNTQPQTYTFTTNDIGKTKEFTFADEPILGSIQVYKQSANPAITNGNSCYSLAGAEYTIKNAAGVSVGTLTTGNDGKSNVKTGLPLGNYTVQETKAPKGYEIDPTVHPVSITETNASPTEPVVVQSEETPLNDPADIEIQKIDAETKQAVTTGAGSLEGAEFTVRYYDGYYNDIKSLPAQATRTWVLKTTYNASTENYAAVLDDIHKVSGPDFYKDSSGRNCFPLGTITIQETKAPEGYTLEDAVFTDGNGKSVDDILLSQITQDTTGEPNLTAGNKVIVSETPVRTDLSFYKYDYVTRKPLANVAFSITSKKTGESHIVVTDEDGYYSTSADYKKHTKDTNANDDLIGSDDFSNAVSGGIWFGASDDIDDEVGALPYDTYIIEELPCEANEGRQLIKAFEIPVPSSSSKEIDAVDLGIMYNTPNPMIHTTATNPDTESSIVLAGEDAVIVDTVSYSFLTAGKTYTVKGVVMDKATNEPLVVNGEEVRAEKTFTVDSEYKDSITEKCGDVDVTFTFDSSSLSGKTLVVFEELYLDGEDTPVAEHKDIEDVGQTVTIPEIHTTAADSETGTNISHPDTEVTIVDTVYYSGLIAGKEYKMTGTLMDKDTGKEVLDKDGNPITSSVLYVAEKPDGYVEVTFTFDGVPYAGKDIVVFEDLYHNDVHYAAHADLTDVNQTVSFPKVHTMAAEKESGEQMVAPDGTVTIVDTVYYENLVSGKTYSLKGTLMDKATGKPVVDGDGKTVVAEASFTADKETGTYEMPFTFNATGLDGITTVVFEELYYSNALVAEHTDMDDAEQTIRFTEVHTTATDSETGTHTGCPKKETTIVDKVEYKNLITGKEYTVKGTLMNKETGEPLLSGGVPVTAETTFTAEEPDGFVELSFTFDSTALCGKSTVAFETFYHNDVPVAVHADLTDKDQTVSFPEIHTIAKSDKGDKIVVKRDPAVIIDTVQYKGLTPGETYTIKGTLMDKSTNISLMADGKPVTAETTFTAESENGSVDVRFEFDATGLGECSLVVFERMYAGNVLIATHEDINDLGQTVSFSDTPKTGDSFPVILIVAAGLLAAAGFTFILIKKKRAR